MIDLASIALVAQIAWSWASGYVEASRVGVPDVSGGSLSPTLAVGLWLHGFAAGANDRRAWAEMTRH